MLHLVVKGSEQAATAIASARGIPFEFVREVPNTCGPPYSIGHVTDGHEQAILKWYLEPEGNAPFPIGTLLHYHELPDGPMISPYLNQPLRSEAQARQERN